MKARKAALATILLGAAMTLPALARTAEPDPLDPAHGVSLPCESLSTPGLVPRSAKNIAHVANVCGFVGTDIEFQSRTASDGLHDYAFVGTMGAGLQIFDITNPARPMEAGGYSDPGWEDDIQVWGDLAVIGVDPIEVTPKTSACLAQYSAVDGGIDVLRLDFDPATARFTTHLVGCVPNLAGGGAHNAQIHPSGQWVAMLNPRGDGSIDIVDLRNGQMRHTYRFVQSGSLTSASCPATGVTFTCVSIGRAGNWSPHDLHFSKDGKTAYTADVGDDTVIVDVSNVLNGQMSVIGIAPNHIDAVDNPNNVAISHQSDITPDGKLLVVTDERGGGLTQTACNEDPNGIIGGAHFWAIKPIAGRPETNERLCPRTPSSSASGSTRTRACSSIRSSRRSPPSGGLERACTIHVFRIGGNGSLSPGEAYPGLDGVSRLPNRQLTTAHYGSGVWWLDFSGPASSSRRHRRGRPFDVGQYPRLERHARRRHLVGQGVQGLHLRQRHGPRLRRLQLHDLPGRGLRPPAHEHAGLGDRRRQARAGLRDVHDPARLGARWRGPVRDGRPVRAWRGQPRRLADVPGQGAASARSSPPRSTR